MLAKRIIPCLDVEKGRVVKGVNFLNLRDAGDPVEIARRYDAEGADEASGTTVGMVQLQAVNAEARTATTAPAISR